MADATTGMIGLGLLGSAIAERLIEAGFEVRGYDLDPRCLARFEQLGGQPVSDPRGLADCPQLVLSLPDSGVVAAVLDSLSVHLQPQTVVIDTTTGCPEATAALAARLAEKRIGYLDATVAGSSAQVRAGEALVLTGGDPVLYGRCQQVLSSFARRTFLVGPAGSGARMKLVVNLVLGLQRAVLAEGLGLARSSGLDLELTLEILHEGPTYCRAIETKGQKMIQEDFHPQARLAQHLKDVRLILEAGQRQTASLPFSLLHKQLLEQLVAAGYGEQDNSAIIKAFCP